MTKDEILKRTKQDFKFLMPADMFVLKRWIEQVYDHGYSAGRSDAYKIDKIRKDLTDDA